MDQAPKWTPAIFVGEYYKEAKKGLQSKDGEIQNEKKIQ